MRHCGGQWSGFGPTDMREKIAIVIIAAMEREVRPLIRRWKVRTIEHDGRRYRVFESQSGNRRESEGAALVCGGIGAAAARRATEALIQDVRPRRVISAGFAGALDSSLRVGDVVEPRLVINAADGVRDEVVSGEGVLVTSATVADKEQKIRLRKAYGASAVDMEAAAVAQGAAAHNLEFAVVKAISDGADFSLPAMDRFVAHDGSFRSVAFACHVALRPWLWSATIKLARNSARATQSLSVALQNYLDRESLGKSTRDATADEFHSDELQKIGATCGSAHTLDGSETHTRAGRNNKV